MARLGSAFSHIAALLFKLEAAVHFKLNEPTVGTSELCAWKACRRYVTAAPLSRISFEQPKRGNLPTMQDSEKILKPAIHNYGWHDPTLACNGISTSSLQQLHALYPIAAIFTSIDSVTLFNEPSTGSLGQDCHEASDTDSDTETSENCIPEPLTSLFDSTASNISQEQLDILAKQRYREYVSTYEQDAYHNLCSLTAKQSVSTAWKQHRAGRKRLQCVTKPVTLK